MFFGAFITIRRICSQQGKNKPKIILNSQVVSDLNIKYHYKTLFIKSY
ncbi:hypothetical protein MADA3029_1190058 [Vibrio nigripulchritudo MADA3029]|nr:hypothetical protein VIBNIAM115_1220001 [Vibrio nigripulchritudo AM115]CCN40485.1 hypothetical protein VIBNIFTn2_1310012 [Vibrio nigripulchritudo FTn2]CCN47992.1 hypothetical protein VIBNIMADA3020_550011 [Vibrio nigripulchritudo MADA3020]CCN53136.1 hypothetical protein VIBNIMADA3021_190058 [Vibrio nigripulchritudo MADA3021]CCN57904.1 hypothetical protein MADA3029_1190058 [Vibrio nigripulchritudo MADA3029]